ncbi:DUF5518 domain-containing protein [Natrinema caseinilyticum]|uniref:DUF5518 domain-containing protein n=1 Tax=Natrinema caseinilyticum TaxID=2961570 RepID=UPI0020C2617C|nr:DUF5518 domain-containing protein [Natrinema caseinilyticum]
MDIDWRAILIGLLLVVVVAVIRGRLVVAINPMILTFSWIIIGVLGGIVTGFLAGGTVVSGAVHGGLMTVFASLLNLVVVTFATFFFAGFVPEFGVLAVGVFLFAFYATPGAIGGAIGSWACGRQAFQRLPDARA